jgi:hypothetical protein
MKKILYQKEMEEEIDQQKENEEEEEKNDGDRLNSPMCEQRLTSTIIS